MFGCIKVEVAFENFLSQRCALSHFYCNKTFSRNNHTNWVSWYVCSCINASHLWVFQGSSFLFLFGKFSFCLSCYIIFPKFQLHQEESCTWSVRLFPKHSNNQCTKFDLPSINRSYGLQVFLSKHSRMSKVQFTHLVEDCSILPQPCFEPLIFVHGLWLRMMITIWHCASSSPALLDGALKHRQQWKSLTRLHCLERPGDIVVER